METIEASDGRGCMIAGAIFGFLFGTGFVFAPAWVGSATFTGAAALNDCFY